MNIQTNTPINFTALPKFQIPVDEKLIRGRAVTCPYRLYKMKQEGITQIIDLRNSARLESPLEKFFCKLLGIKYNNCRYPHRLNKLPKKIFFTNINNLINNNSGKTYIHCQYGKRRTGISVAIYEKEYTNKSKTEILDNLINLGYMELKEKPNSYKIKKIKSILKDFLQKYYPEELKRFD